MAVHALPKTAYGPAVPATSEDIEKETSTLYLCNDNGTNLVTDAGDYLVDSLLGQGYTNPNLHRRVDQDPVVPPGSDYLFVHYDKEGNPYRQHVVISVWDRVHSYRTTETFVHDEESETSEIP